MAKDDEIKCMANYADKTNLIENKDVFVEYIYIYIALKTWNGMTTTYTQRLLRINSNKTKKKYKKNKK